MLVEVGVEVVMELADVNETRACPAVCLLVALFAEGFLRFLTKRYLQLELYVECCPLQIMQWGVQVGVDPSGGGGWSPPQRWQRSCRGLGQTSIRWPVERQLKQASTLL